MQLYVGDYLADTTHLTTEQHGAYMLLLLTMWRHGGKLPNEPQKLARIARTTGRKWPGIWAEIEAFFVVDGDVITNNRLTKEYQKAVRKSELRADAGSLGGKAKALKTKNASVANASGLLYHSSEPEPEPEREGIKPLTPFQILTSILRHETADDFVAHRKSLRKPLTEIAAKRIVSKLEGHADPDAVVDESIASGWAGVFPKTQKGKSNETGQSVAERVAARFGEMDSGESADASFALLPAGNPARRN